MSLAVTRDDDLFSFARSRQFHTVCNIRNFKERIEQLKRDETRNEIAEVVTVKSEDAVTHMTVSTAAILYRGRCECQHKTSVGRIFHYLAHSVIMYRCVLDARRNRRIIIRGLQIIIAVILSKTAAIVRVRNSVSASLSARMRQKKD